METFLPGRSQQTLIKALAGTTYHQELFHLDPVMKSWISGLRPKRRFLSGPLLQMLAYSIMPMSANSKGEPSASPQMFVTV